MSRLPRIGAAPAVRSLAFALLGLAAGFPAYAAKTCSADCESQVTVDTTTRPCTYTWADAKFQVPLGYTPILRWKLVGPASAIWTNDGIFLRTPENVPDQDLAGNTVEANGYYKWEAVHVRPRKFTIDMNIFNGAEQCKQASPGDYEIELQ